MSVGFIKCDDSVVENGEIGVVIFLFDWVICFFVVEIKVCSGSGGKMVIGGKIKDVDLFFVDVKFFRFGFYGLYCMLCI